jgi:hypothetical protein
MISRFLGKAGAEVRANDPQAISTWTDDGLVFHRSAISAAKLSEHKQLDGYLLQLDEEGYLTALSEDVLLQWDDLYGLLSDEAQQSSLSLLALPPTLPLKPQLMSEAALSDMDFRVVISGWQLGGDRHISGGLDRTGALVRLDGGLGLLPEGAWRLLQAVRELVARQREASGERTNQLGWAKIRKLATTCGAGMDGFLRHSIVLHPEKLKLLLRKAPIEGVPVIEIEPGFAGQPDSWIADFDAYDQVQDRYHLVQHDGSVVHVIVTPEVKAVLESIKRMPGRRVAGDEALQIIRNPYAILGADAELVLDPEEFEQSREEAGIQFHRFSVAPFFDEQGRIQHADLLLEAISEQPAKPESIRFETAYQFASFVSELEAKMAAGFSCGFWRGYELELADFRLEDLQGLKALLERWRQEALGRMFDDVFDMSQYGSRVIGLGPVQKVTSPYLGKEGGEKWLPDELLQASGLDADLLNKWDTSNQEHFNEFCERIERAKEAGATAVPIPGVELEVLLDHAERIREAWATKFSAPLSPGAETKERSGLIVDGNIDSAHASAARVSELSEGAKPELPGALRDEIRLKDHQLHGVAWLQNLFEQRNQKVGGCLLADDMGLGKTLQLLTFIAWYLERDASAPPILIVAPVSLLDNWEREFERFFHTAGMPMLKLYGASLSAVKLKKGEIPAKMQEMGIRNLLRPGWVGEARIVLTTYETLRDQELSLARQKWGIVVCDEAQKIKNPAAMITQAAKAIHADFCVACTGTPVENSLTDLWCLFDFVQPGLLGALNEFGGAYRRPIECKTDQDNLALERLRALIAPQLLRRTKDEVADLPPKIEDKACRRLPLSTLQDKLYRSEVAQHKVKGEMLTKVGDRNIAVLGLLHTLKLVCAHPHAVRPEGALLDVSPKMRWLMSTLTSIRDAGEKVIIFTELRDIQRDLRIAVMDHFRLPEVSIINGDTSAVATRGPSRQGIIDRFQAEPGFGVIILSTTAVGFGVNVQAANHVIHFTRPWNPAKEDQATDRAYRIGQTRRVSVYYPTVISDAFDTFEHKLDLLLSKKREVAHDMLNGAEDIPLMDLA